MQFLLWGFMGAGKSYLRQSLGFPGFDFDTELLKRFGKPKEELGEFIERIGWKEFREAENILFQEVVKKGEEGVYSLGGGCLLDTNYAWNTSDSVEIIWLNTPIEICWERVKNDKNRPLVKKGREEFEKRYFDRIGNYKKSDQIFTEISEAKKYIAERFSRNM